MDKKNRQRDRPNILLITADQHNHEILGCYGNSVVKTPHLDKLAEQGVLFSNAYTPRPLCTPARSSIFTSVAMQTQKNINMYFGSDVDSGVKEEHAVFPLLLREHGYATALVGKLHTRDVGDRNFGLQYTWLAEGKGHFIGVEGKRDDYREYLHRKGYPESAWRTGTCGDYQVRGYCTSPFPQEDYIDYRVTEESMRFLAGIEQPFFLWTSYCNPHPAWDPPRPYDTMYAPSEIPRPHRKEGSLEKKHPSLLKHIVTKTFKTREGRPGEIVKDREEGLAATLENAYRKFPEDVMMPMLAAYYGEVSFIDKEIGRLLQFMDERGLLDDTVIVYTSDHGDHVGTNWQIHKGGPPYNSIIKVPFIVKCPSTRAQVGQGADDLVSLLDLAPTFLDVAGIDIPRQMEGVSLLRKEGRREFITIGTGTVAVIKDDWKLIRFKDGFVELYNLKTDPHEQDNVADGYPGIVRELAAKTHEHT